MKENPMADQIMIMVALALVAFAPFSTVIMWIAYILYGMLDALLLFTIGRSMYLLITDPERIRVIIKNRKTVQHGWQSLVLPFAMMGWSVAFGQPFLTVSILLVLLTIAIVHYIEQAAIEKTADPK